MIEIKDILAGLSNILLKEEMKTDLVRDVIKKTTGIEIPIKDIKIQNHTIYLNIKPIYKNEIFLKQEEIQKKIEESLIKKIPKNIR